jgi:hypothetical protein
MKMVIAIWDMSRRLESNRCNAMKQPLAACTADNQAVSELHQKHAQCWDLHAAILDNNP